MKLLRYINTCMSKQIKVYKTVQSRPKRRLRPLVFGWEKHKGLLLCRTCLPALIQWVHLPPIFFRRKHLLKAGSRSARINKNWEIDQLKFWNKLILKKLLWVSAVCQLCHKIPSPAGGSRLRNMSKTCQDGHICGCGFRGFGSSALCLKDLPAQAEKFLLDHECVLDTVVCKVAGVKASFW